MAREDMSMTVSDYFERLWQRRGDALLPEPRTVAFADGTHPVPAQCHANADRWADENPDFTAVRGWLCMSYGFERHSVVRDRHNRLVEITLASAYPFLAHRGEASTFTELGELGCNQVFWPPAVRAIEGDHEQADMPTGNPGAGYFG